MRACVRACVRPYVCRVCVVQHAAADTTKPNRQCARPDLAHAPCSKISTHSVSLAAVHVPLNSSTCPGIERACANACERAVVRRNCTRLRQDRGAFLALVRAAREVHFDLHAKEHRVSSPRTRHAPCAYMTRSLVSHAPILRPINRLRSAQSARLSKAEALGDRMAA